jgi:hypothetical protein
MQALNFWAVGVAPGQPEELETVSSYRITVLYRAAGISYELESLGALPMGCEDIACQLVMIASNLAKRSMIP